MREEEFVRESIQKCFVLMMALFLVIGMVPESVSAASTPGVSYQTHIENIGWEADAGIGLRSNGEASGTFARSLRLEGIKINLDNQGYDLGIAYQTHIENIGWEADAGRGWKSNGDMSGTSHQSLRLEAIQIKLTGADASKFDIYYQVHAENFGWLGWAKNGESAGTAGYSYRLEAIRIQIVPKGQGAPTSTTALPFYDKNAPIVNPTTPTTDGILKVSYIDVGQADSILIQQGDHAMLIDAGNNADGQTVKNYITNQGVSVLDYAICTHPHEDHIGAMDYIVNSFKIGKIYLPEAMATTQTYKDLLTAVVNKGMQFTSPVPGSSFKLGDATCTILGPINWSQDDLNTSSIVLKVVYGNNSFLFTGDAQVSNEQDMINAGYDLSADVLKVGHHGSNTSTSQAFLDAVKPSYAVISVGAGNDYGHPTEAVLNRINSNGIKLFRTDLNGTIVATSDGSNITFNVNPTNSAQVDPTPTDPTPVTPTPTPTPTPVNPQDYTVYKTATGTKYHKAGCSYLSKSSIPLLKSEAVAAGLTPCSKCNP
jgi:competence protein ComEC